MLLPGQVVPAKAQVGRAQLFQRGDEIVCGARRPGCRIVELVSESRRQLAQGYKFVALLVGNGHCAHTITHDPD